MPFAGGGLIRALCRSLYKKSRVEGIEKESLLRQLSDAIHRRYNISFNRSGISLRVIVNLSHDADASRPVNSGVRHASQKQEKQCLVWRSSEQQVLG